MRYLITGGCGFLGSNLGAEALRRGDDLCVLDNFYRIGSKTNFAWLQTQGNCALIEGDVRDARTLREAIADFRPEVVFHLAGQVAMTTSIQDPRLDFEVNALGTLNLLEAVRAEAPEAAVIYSSTNKVYGDLEQHRYLEGATRYTCPDAPEGFDERVPLDFHSPYGCSKGAADQYMLDYHRVFGLHTVVFRHSSIFGGRQFSSEDQGWVGWFIQKALELSKNPALGPFCISGTGKQVRDVLFVDDLINCYFSAAARIQACQGQAFNIGGGAANSLSLLELFAWLEDHLGVKMQFERLPWRCSDQRIFIADTRKARTVLEWEPSVSKTQGLIRMISWARECSGD
jgi:CDP-paratose 2-epimerase